MSLLDSPRRSAVAAAEILLVVLLVNVLEFFGVFGRFSPYGVLATFSMAGLGVAATLSALVAFPFPWVSTRTARSLLAFGLTLLVGCVPTYLLFGCVFWGCPG
ncbi:hypothetical protein [Halopelagius longus]|uniref:Uncharacterized protein n=1 Tax=Halopelagius longus TaxID=1236180 RepID=A0A1H1B6W0_9EURY|nr:hypothetical protein [Halopelagius longus]SDQ47685.1 hypothetical protein SAMN05216278_1666 [Halopelagius longus]